MGEESRAQAHARDFVAMVPVLSPNTASTAFAEGVATALFAYWCRCDLANGAAALPAEDSSLLPWDLRWDTPWTRWAALKAPRARSREAASAMLATQPVQRLLATGPWLVRLEAQAGARAVRAGEPTRMLPVLRHLTESCGDLFDPFAHTRAHLWLGMALEQTGDRAGACRAYDVVLERWSHAEPRSLTAEDARQRAAQLGCKARSNEVTDRGSLRR
jgi:hypothetical protein